MMTKCNCRYHSALRGDMSSSQPRPMTVDHRWGRPLPETARASVNVNHTSAFAGQWGEMNWRVDFSPRPPSHGEWASTVSEFVRQFHIENPGLEIRFLEATRGSPHEIRIQFICHDPSRVLGGQGLIGPITWAAVAAAMAAILAFIVKNFVGILAVMFLFAIGSALARWLRGPTYQCYICGAVFDTWEALVAHIQYEHPGAPIPPRPSLFPPEVIRAGLILGATGIGALLVYRLVTARKP